MQTDTNLYCYARFYYLLSQPSLFRSVSFTVCAYDPTEYLTDWEVNPGADDRLSNSEKRRIITRISAHCLCNAVLADTRQLDES